MWNDCGMQEFEASDTFDEAKSWLVAELKKTRDWVRDQNENIEDTSEKMHNNPAVACIYRLDEDGETDCHPDDIVENLI